MSLPTREDPTPEEADLMRAAAKVVKRIDALRHAEARAEELSKELQGAYAECNTWVPTWCQVDGCPNPIPTRAQVALFETLGVPVKDFLGPIQSCHARGYCSQTCEERAMDNVEEFKRGTLSVVRETT